MEFGFRESQASYKSGSQNARAWTEQWVSEWLYCPNCGHSHLSQFPPNLPVADFFCGGCNDQFELKSTKKPFGSKIAVRSAIDPFQMSKTISEVSTGSYKKAVA